jgi:hypothetical protein
VERLEPHLGDELVADFAGRAAETEPLQDLEDAVLADELLVAGLAERK